MDPRSVALAAGLGAALALDGRSATIVVVPPTRISALVSPPDTNSEPAIIASPFSPNEVLIGWQHAPADGSAQKAFYAVSLNGLLTIAAGPAPMPVPSQPGCAVLLQADVMVASSRFTGDLYLAAQAFSHEEGAAAAPDLDTITIVRKPLGSAVLADAAQMIPCAGPDKGFLAIGPQPPTSGDVPFRERAYVGYYDRIDSGRLKTARSLSSSIVGTQWPLNGEPGSPTVVRSHGTGSAPQAGIGSFPLVLGMNSSKPGRLILGYSPGSAHTERPEITASDDGGGPNATDWNIPVSADRQFTQYFDPTSGVAVAIKGVGGLNSSTDPIPLPACQPLLMDARTWPSLSEDPRTSHGDTVVAAWAGRIEGDDQHLVIFIAESTDAGATPGLTFPVGDAQTPPQRWACKADRLGIPGGSVWMPSIAIDGLGGVNLLFIWTLDVGICAGCAPSCSGCPFPPCGTSCPPPRVVVRYARWASINDVATGAAPAFTMDLSPPFRAWCPGTGNDYVMIAASGCDVYPSWAQQTVDGRWDVYAAHFTDTGCAAGGPGPP